MRGKGLVHNRLIVFILFIYFTAVSSIGASTASDPNCILIEDAQVTLPREEKNNNSKMPVKGTF